MCCQKCKHLDKGRSSQSTMWYLYGCNKHASTWIKGWIRRDADLAEVSCEQFEEEEESV